MNKTIIFVNIFLFILLKHIYLANNFVQFNNNPNNNFQFNNCDDDDDSTSKINKQLPKLLPLTSIQSTPYNKQLYFETNTTQFTIDNAQMTISKTITATNDQLQYFILNNLNLLFTQTNMIQQDPSNVQPLHSTLTVAIYFDPSHVIRQYTIDISSIPLYSSTPTIKCQTNAPSSSCNIDVGTCGPATVNCHSLCTLQAIPVTLQISSSQFYSFSPNILLENNSTLFVTITSSSASFYFTQLYLTYTLFKQ